MSTEPQDDPEPAAEFPETISPDVKVNEVWRAIVNAKSFDAAAQAIGTHRITVESREAGERAVFELPDDDWDIVVTAFNRHMFEKMFSSGFDPSAFTSGPPMGGAPPAGLSNRRRRRGR
jgi:hypothetical protein